MPERSQQLGQERHTAGQPDQWNARTQKLARFFGVIAGNSTNIGFESQFGSTGGSSFDWDPWIRLLMPDFAVVMTADRREAVRWPTAIIITETGQVVPIDREQCHPSDASSLLSGEKMSEIVQLTDALISAIHEVFDGTRETSALRTVKQLQRICRKDL